MPPRVSRPWVLCAAVAWLVMAVLPANEPDPVKDGPFEGWVTARTDVIDGKYEPWAIGSIDGVTVLMELGDTDLRRGDRLLASGHLRAHPGAAAGHEYSGVLEMREAKLVEPSTNWAHRAGRAIASRVDDRLQPFDTGRGLLAGFLIGDVTHVGESDEEAMRRSGLAHFVAVSGSNVALFLGLLALVAGPLAMGPRRRAVIGLIGLPAYVAATRFEPSVMRAAVMAGIALCGRLAGVVLEAWQLLALAVGALVIYDRGLTGNVGFQLSVAATAGVLAGARWPVDGKIRRALVITIGAQAAVAPLLLLHFGSVPLLSPLTNLVAAPLVSVATIAGALGVAGAGFLVGPAAEIAELVLHLARGAATWPQLDLGEFSMVALSLGLLMLTRRMRPVASLALAVTVSMLLVWPGVSLPPGSVTVLNVGQGDAILLSGGQSRYALVDGGPDPAILRDKLRHFGVKSLELVVLTHVHADHVTGLTGLVGVVPIRRIWMATEPHRTSTSAEFAALADMESIPVDVPLPGDRVELGALDLEVKGPIRRYASPNDQSVVIEVTGAARRMLLSGDIETFAQADLATLRADVLKVPHQGAATSDPDWLISVGADVAVISVGPNDFGHPAGWVVELLGASGAEVLRTDLDGDVTVELGTPTPSDNLGK